MCTVKWEKYWNPSRIDSSILDDYTQKFFKNILEPLPFDKYKEPPKKEKKNMLKDLFKSLDVKVLEQEVSLIKAGLRLEKAYSIGEHGVVYASKEINDLRARLTMLEKFLGVEYVDEVKEFKGYKKTKKKRS